MLQATPPSQRSRQGLLAGLGIGCVAALLGVAGGELLLGRIAPRWLMLALGLLLLGAAMKSFQHTKPSRSESCS